MIHFEDNAREALLEYLNKPKRKLILCCGKTDVLRKFKNDKSGENIYIIDHDENGVVNKEISESIVRVDSFKHITDIQLYEDKDLNEKFIVIFNVDFPAWLMKALSQIGKKPSNYGFDNKKGSLHKQIRDKERKNNFKKLLIDMNKEQSKMLQDLKDIFVKINHKE